MIKGLGSALLFLLCSHLGTAQISFLEIGADAGINKTTTTFGASWGDVNGDGWPDIFIGNHHRPTIPSTSPPDFFLNNGDESFTQWTPDIFNKDIHGAAFSDPDNDGDADLLILTGGPSNNQLLVNLGGLNFLDNAARARIIDSTARGRIPIWADFDKNGLLDVALVYAQPNTAEQSYSSLFLRNGKGFVNISDLAGFTKEVTSNLGTLADIDGDRKLELLMVYRQAQLDYFDFDLAPTAAFQFDSLARITKITDLVSGDFNGDLKTDLLLVRNEPQSNALQLSDTLVRAHLLVLSDEKGIQFRTSDNFKLALNAATVPYPIYLGLDSVLTGSQTIDITMDSLFFEMKPHLAGIDTGIYLGFDTANAIWNLLFSAAFDTKGLDVAISSDSSVVLERTVGFSEAEITLGDKLLFWSDTGYCEIHVPGFDSLSGSITAIAADFDNDMDLDLFLGCSAGYPNLPNVLLENINNIAFEKTAVSGAEGSMQGLTGSVTTADFNKDGYLDIFACNGNRDIYQGAYELFKNLGSGRHFISIKLEGVLNNRDGIGSVLICYAGGKAQLREHYNGIHRRSQNESSIHFGLDTNTVIDSLHIFWPSGLLQREYLLPVDTFLVLSEISVAIPLESAADRKGSNMNNNAAAETLPKLSIYPNPAQQFIQVLTPLATASSYNIYALDGRLVLQGTLLPNREINVDVRELVEGTYQLLLYDAAQQVIASSLFKKQVSK